MAKNKKRNKPGRKPPAFAQLINRISNTCQLTYDEMMAKIKERNGPDAKPELDDIGRQKWSPLDLPENCTVVDSLNGHTIFSNARLADHVEQIAMCLCEFDDDFWEGSGCSIRELRRDRKNRTWGDDMTILNLVYLALASELAVWSKPRTEWRELPYGLPFIKFTGPRRTEVQEMIKTPANKENENEQNSTSIPN